MRVIYEYPPPWIGLVPGPYELTLSQQKIGNKITYICGKHKNQDFINNDFIDLIKIGSRRPIIYSGTFSTAGIKAFFAIVNNKKQFDIIHGHGHLPFYYHLYRLFRKEKTPYVYHLHITSKGRQLKKDHYDWITRIKGFFLWPLMIICERIGCTVARKIIAVSKNVKDEIVQHYKIDPDKIIIVENGVNTAKFDQTKQISELNGIKKGDYHHLLYVGVLNKRKNLANIIKTMDKLPKNFVLNIIGEGDSRNYLIDLIKKYNLKRKVHLLGSIDYENIHKYYLFSDAFILLSFYEGLPKVVLEALSSGLQIFSTRSFKISSTIGDYINWLDSDDPTYASEYIQKNMEIRKIPINILNNISWDNKALEIQGIYNSIVG